MVSFTPGAPNLSKFLKTCILFSIWFCCKPRFNQANKAAGYNSLCLSSLPTKVNALDKNLSYGWLGWIVYSLAKREKIHMSLKTARLDKNMAHLFFKDRGSCETFFLGIGTFPYGEKGKGS